VQSLHKLGVTTVIDLRGERRSQSEDERKQAESLGMKFLLIPGNGWAPPTDAQVAQFFQAIAERPQRTIFIHCWFGEDRTGVFIATYRIAFEDWTPQQALAEMRDFRFNSFWHPAMIDYVKHFPERLASSGLLAPYRTPPASLSSPATSTH
jgi:protein tyrosine/serine phosphatase